MVADNLAIRARASAVIVLTNHPKMLRFQHKNELIWTFLFEFHRYILTLLSTIPIEYILITLHKVHALLWIETSGPFY